MSVTQESGGRLNAFAKEPKIEVITPKESNSNRSRLFLIAGLAVLIALITFTVRIS